MSADLRPAEQLSESVISAALRPRDSKGSMVDSAGLLSAHCDASPSIACTVLLSLRSEP